MVLPENISPFVYSIKHEKGMFLEPLLNIENCVEHHKNVVDIRNDVAHASGNHKELKDFINYIKMCLYNISQTKNVIWNNFRQSTKFNNELKNMISWDDIVSIFLISPVEFEDLFKEKYNDVIKEKLSDLSLWKNMISKILIANATIKDLKVNIEEIKIRMLDVQDDNAFCFCSANVKLYFETTKNNHLYKKQEQSLNNYPFSFEYNLITNNSSIEITEISVA